jgi:hypothetical protein
MLQSRHEPPARRSAEVIAALIAAAPLLLDNVPAGVQPIGVSLSRECTPAGCPLLVASGGAQMAVPGLLLPAGEPARDGAQWSVAGVFFSLRALQLGKVGGVLIEVLRVPEGEGQSLGEWRVVARTGGALKQLLAFADTDRAMGIGRVALIDQVLHWTHERKGDARTPDRFDHAAWDWSGSGLRRLSGATLFVVAAAAGASIEEMRRTQREVESRCPDVGALRSYESARFEGLPQRLFAGAVLLRRAEAAAQLERVRRCAPMAEIFETAFLPP